MRWELGVSTWMWQDSDLIEALPLVRGCGIENIEVVMRTPPHCNYQDRGYMRRLTDSLEEWNVKICQLHPPMLEYDIASLDETVRTFSLDFLTSWVDTFIDFGKPILGIHPGKDFPRAEPQNRGVRLRRCEESFKSIVKFCEGRGVRVAVECKAKEGKMTGLGDNLDEFLEIIHSCDSDYLGALVDTGHAEGVSSPAEYIRACGRKLFALHVHDNSGESDHLIPGEGKIDWDSVVRALEEVGYRGVFLVEVPGKGDLHDRLRQVAEAGRKLVTRQNP